jgi:hypothetical protein
VVPSLTISADSRRLVRVDKNQNASSFRGRVRGCEFALHFGSGGSFAESDGNQVSMSKSSAHSTQRERPGT